MQTTSIVMTTKVAAMKNTYMVQYKISRSNLI